MMMVLAVFSSVLVVITDLMLTARLMQYHHPIGAIPTTQEETVVVAAALEQSRMAKSALKKAGQKKRSLSGPPSFLAPKKTKIKFLEWEENFCNVTDLQVIAYVHSAPANRKSRDAIRATWGHPEWFPVLRHKVIFVVGMPQDNNQLLPDLLHESRTHHDLLLGNFHDTYHDISFKAIAAIWWVVHYCPAPPFILKTDDDMFVNIFTLAELVKNGSRYYVNENLFGDKNGPRAPIVRHEAMKVEGMPGDPMEQNKSPKVIKIQRINMKNEESILKAKAKERAEQEKHKATKGDKVSNLPNTANANKAPQPNTANANKAPQPNTANANKAPQPNTANANKAPQPNTANANKAPQPNTANANKAPQLIVEMQQEEPLNDIQHEIKKNMITERAAGNENNQKKASTIQNKKEIEKKKKKEFYSVDINSTSIYCRIWDKTVVIRDNSSKWFVSSSEFDREIFPTYCSGSAYLYTRGAATALLKASTKSNLLWLDDVYITGVLAEKGRVPRVKIDELFQKHERKIIKSEIHGNRIFFHVVDRSIFPKLVRNLWETVALGNRNF
ncbi:hypothetical protein Pcinc_031754 [Petrolisthes cinctipes]|uniref:Hexosyltransferase n=1 Tax=Petrolisthes cinctipes TaxID=88211 RepID=A0AAE1K0H8_PETCI|nr:hypothetical protein Pcinc_031754 [Petrolisthes cinctipes]